MRPGELLQWQWEGYPRYHRSWANLLLHAFAIPLFAIGNLTALFALPTLSLSGFSAGLLAMGFSVLLQGRGHRLEPVPPEPFTGAANFVGRIFLEQWVNFPRFVLSGGWYRNWRGQEP